MIDTVSFCGWPENLRLRNATTELIVTLRVGPRILSYTTGGGLNPFKIYDDQIGTADEAVWRNRGGHRLWLAPETREVTYHPDNAPVAWQQLGPRSVRLTPPAEVATGWQKQIDVTLDEVGTGVAVLHRIRRIAATPGEAAIWALSVMTPGGCAVMPQPPLGEHPRDMLPNRPVVLWPYTDLSDPRWTFGPRYFRLRQDTSRGATKIGLGHAPGWAAYLVGEVCFLKRFPRDAAAAYPDFGCNCEVFSNAKMLEVESLGPVTRVAPGASVEHVERWSLHAAPPGLASQPDDALDAYFNTLN